MFQVTHVIIPQQTATSTSWEVTDYGCIPTHLKMIGLIHTHPGFEAFMSSVDLHALYDYDRGSDVTCPLISIVVAPERNEAPVFKLTALGRKVLNCLVDPCLKVL